MEEVRTRLEEVRASFELPPVTSPEEVDEVEDMLSFDGDDDETVFDDESDAGLDDSFIQEGMRTPSGQRSVFADDYQDLTRTAPARVFYTTRSPNYSSPSSSTSSTNSIPSLRFKSKMLQVPDADTELLEAADEIENLSRILQESSFL